LSKIIKYFKRTLPSPDLAKKFAKSAFEVAWGIEMKLKVNEKECFA